MIHRTFPLWVALGIAIPAAAGYLVTGTWRGAFEAALWGGAVRIFLAHHMTWSINSVCHFFGTRRFDVEDHSTNVFWLAPFSMGESWHHNHHTFPRSAFHGLKSLGDRPDGLGHPRDAGDEAGVERGRDHARAPAREARLPSATRGPSPASA